MFKRSFAAASAHIMLAAGLAAERTRDIVARGMASAVPPPPPAYKGYGGGKKSRFGDGRCNVDHVLSSIKKRMRYARRHQWAGERSFAESGQYPISRAKILAILDRRDFGKLSADDLVILASKRGQAARHHD